MLRGTVKSFIAIFALVFLTVTPVQAHQHRATRLGNPATRFAGAPQRRSIRAPASRRSRLLQWRSRVAQFPPALGDAMMRAHTEGLNLARSLGLPLASSAVRIVNTQDIFAGALVPAALLLVHKDR